LSLSAVVLGQAAQFVISRKGPAVDQLSLDIGELALLGAMHHAGEHLFGSCKQERLLLAERFFNLEIGRPANGDCTTGRVRHLLARGGGRTARSLVSNLHPCLLDYIAMGNRGIVDTALESAAHQGAVTRDGDERVLDSVRWKECPVGPAGTGGIDKSLQTRPFSLNCGLNETELINFS
jgi:hypothetical protein